jgi:hypothetical protein
LLAVQLLIHLFIIRDIISRGTRLGNIIITISLAFSGNITSASYVLDAESDLYSASRLFRVFPGNPKSYGLAGGKNIAFWIFPPDKNDSILTSPCHSLIDYYVLSCPFGHFVLFFFID